EKESCPVYDTIKKKKKNLMKKKRMEIFKRQNIKDYELKKVRRKNEGGSANAILDSIIKDEDIHGKANDECIPLKFKFNDSDDDSSSQATNDPDVEGVLSCEVQMSEFEDVVRMSEDLSVVIQTIDVVKGALSVEKSWLTKSKPFLASDLGLMPVSKSLLRVDTLKNLVLESMSLKFPVEERSLLEEVLASFM
nr:ARID DNA-binding domain-containing protein [Tanacetum cinerariifolium]